MWGMEPGMLLQLGVLIGGGCITVGMIKSTLREFGRRLERIENFIDANFRALPPARAKRR